jgi:Flp pilus assembly pilin Flp
MRTKTRTRFTRESGQTMTEYAVTLAVITIASVGIFSALSGSISGVINNVVSLIP